MIKLSLPKVLAAFLFLLFLLVEVFHLIQIDQLSAYAIYGFELVFFLLTLVSIKRFEWRRGQLGLGFASLAFLALALGFGAYEFASFQGYAIPFSMTDGETLLFLLGVAPLLEELIYRGALWSLLETLSAGVWLRMVSTSILFCYAHYQAIWVLPAEFQSFVQFQAVYSLGLAVILGGVRLNLGIVPAIGVHFIFNFGFFLGQCL